MRINNYFQVGGSLESGHQSYVEREADLKLIQALENDRFCFILNSRQMGKSSLMLKTAARLLENDIDCAFADLSILGTYLNKNESRFWYKSLADQLLESLDLDLEIDLDSWWQENNNLTPEAQLKKFFDKLLLKKCTGKVVVFIDEIDSIINVLFKDDFFALLRGLYNQRAINPEYKRLSFCLLGVASPHDLIEDKTRTPFNIGKSIELMGLTFTNAKKTLIVGLDKVIEDSEAVLQEILWWTGGQPFLTQKLCRLVVENAVNNRVEVSEIVEEYIINNWEAQDEPQHLRTIRDRLLANEQDIVKILAIYRELLQDKKVAGDGSLEQAKLRLSGLVCQQNNYLKIYNPIYRAIFNRNWVVRQLENICPYRAQLDAWLESGKDLKYLLSKNDLERAEKWSENKSLSRDDYQFLAASRQAIIQQQLASAEAEKKRIINRGKKYAIILIGVAGAIVSAFIMVAIDKIREAEITQLNKDSTTALRQFDLGQQLNGLITGIKTSQQLLKLVGNPKNIARYSTKEPLVSLNQILNQIAVKNKLQTSQEAITEIIYSSDGEIIFYSHEKGIVNQWQIKNNRTQSWNGLSKQETIKDIAISSERQRIFVASENSQRGKIQKISDRGELLNVFDIDGVASLALSPDGEILISGDNNGRLFICKQDGTLIKTWQGHQGKINSIAFSPDGQKIASGSDDATVKIWTLSGDLQTTLIGHNNIINQVIFSPDGTTIASASNDTTVKLWSAVSNWSKTLVGHTQSVNSIAFSPDGKTIASASDDNTIKLWSNLGDRQATYTSNLTAINSIAFSPDGKNLVSGDGEGLVKIWATLPPLDIRVSTGIFSRDLQSILIADPLNNTVRIKQGNNLKITPPLKLQFITSMASSADDRTLFVGTESGMIYSLNLQENKAWQEINPQEAYQGEIKDFDVSPQGDLLITLGINQLLEREYYVLKLWDKDGELLKTLNDDNQEVLTAVHFTPNGDRFLVSNLQGEIALWDADGKLKNIVDASRNRDLQRDIIRIALSSNGKLLATANANGDIQLRTNNGNLVTTFRQRVNRKIVNLDFSQDGKTILTIDSWGRVTSWDLDLEKAIARGCDWLRDYLQTTKENSDLLCE